MAHRDGVREQIETMAVELRELFNLQENSQTVNMALITDVRIVILGQDRRRRGDGGSTRASTNAVDVERPVPDTGRQGEGLRRKHEGIADGDQVPRQKPDLVAGAEGRLSDMAQNAGL